MSNNASLFKLFLMILLSAVLIGGCKKEESGAYKWGEASYYKKFLWSKSDPVVMKHTLEFEFNEYANEDVKSVKFGLYEKNDAGEFVPVSDDIILYKNGEVCDGTTFFVTPEDKTVELGIEFTPEAENGCHVWYLKVLDAGGLDCIDDQRITEEDQTPLLLEWEANYDKQANPLKVGCIIALITIVTALAVWILVLRFMLFPRFRVRRLIVDGKHIPVKGFIKVIFTSKNKKQPAIAALFTGKIKYVNTFLAVKEEAKIGKKLTKLEKVEKLCIEYGIILDRLNRDQNAGKAAISYLLTNPLNAYRKYK